MIDAKPAEPRPGLMAPRQCRRGRSENRAGFRKRDMNPAKNKVWDSEPESRSCCARDSGAGDEHRADRCACHRLHGQRGLPVRPLVSFAITSQRVRPEVPGPMTGSAKQSSPEAPTWTASPLPLLAITRSLNTPRPRRGPARHRQATFGRASAASRRARARSRRGYGRPDRSAARQEDKTRRSKDPP